MADSDLKKFLTSVQKEITRLGDQVEIVVNKVDRMEGFQIVVMEQVRFIRDQLSVMNKKLDSHGKILGEHTNLFENRVLPPLAEIELTVKSYKDRYQINQKNIERLDTRLNTVEEELAINPPEELKVPHFSD